MATSPHILPTELHLTAYRGDAFDRSIRLWQNKNGTMELLNTSGYTARMHIKADKTDTVPLLELTTANGRITTGIHGGDEIVTTTLASAAASGATTVTLTDATGVATGHTIAIALDAGYDHAATVTDVAGADVTLSTPMPDAAAMGNAVAVRHQPYVLTLYAPGGDVADTTGILPAGLIGAYDLEVEDRSGRAKSWLYGEFRVQGDVTR